MWQDSSELADHKNKKKKKKNNNNITVVDYITILKEFDTVRI